MCFGAWMLQPAGAPPPGKAANQHYTPYYHHHCTCRQTQAHTNTERTLNCRARNWRPYPTHVAKRCSASWQHNRRITDTPTQLVLLAAKEDVSPGAAGSHAEATAAHITLIRACGDLMEHHDSTRTLWALLQLSTAQITLHRRRQGLHNPNNGEALGIPDEPIAHVA